ncbi:N-succinylarginine dihydrolase [Acidithiobacillus thiooxidans]|uniref:N-succinylarginine dihydrolase n=1 Tax=Acidithiobacillus thiooxidans TaxID=930 RepID=UPI0002624A61|nr:N-succinylarginine dihydrolase [Acidithiobacillus thiooxidans]
MSLIEVNMDGLVGPSHHYAGLSHGNLASAQNARKVANPKAAALQGLAKMKFLHDLGLVQGVIPPPATPRLSVLKRLGFSGSTANILAECAKLAPDLLSAVHSAAAMWAANAATVSSAFDTNDGKVHITPANLNSTFHRSLETSDTAFILEKIFPDRTAFVHHPGLPAHSNFADEGAANHCRLSCQNREIGVSVFVYGRSAYQSALPRPLKFPARQTLEASQAVARSHGLNPDLCLFVQQNPEAIDQGAFHNDVVAVSHENILFCHEKAFLNQNDLRRRLATTFARYGEFLHWIEVPAARVSLKDAIQSYIFNSQIVTTPQGKVILIAPEECRANVKVWDFLNEILEQQNPLSEIRTIDLGQSMRNGGGPACLRLRVPVSTAALQTVHSGILLSTELVEQLTIWIQKNYRDRLQIKDLADPAFLRETQEALTSLSSILRMDSLYDFQ